MKRLRSRLSTADAGMSLIELLVTIVVLGIVLTIIGALFLQVSRATAEAETARGAIGTASNAMDEMRRVVREAADNPVVGGSSDPAVVSGSGSALTVMSFLNTDPANPAPTRVVFSINAAGALVETRTAAVASNGFWVFTGASSTATIAGPLVTTGTPLFQYSDENGIAITPSGTGLTAAQCANVAAVTLTVTTASKTAGSSDPVVLTATVVMANLLDSGSN